MSENALELSRMVKVRPLPADRVVITPDASECAALSERFGIIAIERLEACLSLESTSAGITAKGPMTARITQACAVSGDDFLVSVSEDLELLFVEQSTLDARENGEVNEDGAIEVDLFAQEAEEIGYEGDGFDLGEAVAQSLGLAIDPYAEGPNADAARKDAGIADKNASNGPLADALSAALKKK
ncbi:MAG: DUF177 domain-containing protein [Pseudomonadota bacterium]